MVNLARVEHRRALADFVRARRERTRPEDVGLPGGARRRTPGLRREEVAHLAGVGITWYTWFEQGRDIQVSADFLERLCRGFRLDAAERSHLFTLAQHRPPPHAPLREATISAPVMAVLHALPFPAYIRTLRWDVLAWNDAARVLFGDFGALPPETRNILTLVFTEPAYRNLMADWEGDARRVMAKFRLDYGRANGDASFAALVEQLCEASAEFNQWWPRHDVLGPWEGLKRIRHEKLGEMAFRHTAFAVDNTPDLRMVAYAPASEREAEFLQRLRTRKVDAIGDGDSAQFLQRGRAPIARSRGR